jgi:hypothetical protein
LNAEHYGTFAAVIMARSGGLPLEALRNIVSGVL